MHIRKYGNITLTSPQRYESGGIHPYHHEILYISSGEIQLSWLNEVYETRGPALFFLTPNTPHQLTKISTQYSFLFMEADIQHDPFLNLSEMMRWNTLQCGMQAPSYALSAIIQTMNLIRNHFESELSTHTGLINQLVTAEMQKVVLLVRHIVTQSLHTAKPDKKLRAESDDGVKTETEEAVDMLMHFMESYYRENITLKDLTDRIHLNPSYLIRVFKQMKGMTPFQYLNNLRMNAAISHLENSELSVQDIVKLTGYQSIHYFSRVFKNTYGVSPTIWRQNHRTVP
ncbi:AraC family transcriptional regulator [Cohnella phaseoli]|uniref:AraC-like DNA-binding protein n=1 Tax=Cohnella phaseoli TaxID=456490 RepID=A0A3D9IU45_9BACL|nr:AraC family transcriptional regulator [Cohnella phaseoli]RED65280.1 AraC-like DNA-binding protein [Cohnella phaseoli]